MGPFFITERHPTTPMHIDAKEEMLRALETIILQESRTELRRVAMKRYLEMTEKDKDE